jgi:hypothetical protein
MPALPQLFKENCRLCLANNARKSAAVQQQSQLHNRNFRHQSMSTSATAVYPATSSPPQNVRQYRQHVTFLSSRADSISRRLPAVATATPTRRTATLTSTSVDDRRQLFDYQLSIASSSSSEGTCSNPNIVSDDQYFSDIEP